MASILQPFVSALESLNKYNEKYLSLSYEELKDMTVWERVRTHNWYFELFSLGLILCVILSFYAGQRWNTSNAEGIMNPVCSLLRGELQFSKVGFGSNEPYRREHLNTWFYTSATGRSGVELISVVIHAVARSNPLAIIMENLVAIFFPSMARDNVALTEYVEVIIKPNGIHVSNESANVNNDRRLETLSKLKFTTAIVHKSHMNKIRSGNYYLSLTHTSEGLGKLPREYVYMSEINQLNGFLERYAGPQLVADVLIRCSKILQFMAITELPSRRPADQKSWSAMLNPRLIIRTDVPKNKKDTEALLKLIRTGVEIIDNFTRECYNQQPTMLTNDILKRCDNVRSQSLQRVIKDAKERERESILERKRESELEKRKVLKKSGELDKLDQKMKEKRERRARNKRSVKM